ncbi:MAG: hypothetical protein JO112_10490 [Planctomycetes bacterium]|nr:hypothetical protein [Planctomycetota bacterium]
MRLPFGLLVATILPFASAGCLINTHSLEKDYRRPILPPIQEGFPPPLCEDPPDVGALRRNMKGGHRRVPYFFDERCDNIQVMTEKLVDKLDPPHFFPLIGPAQLHHCQWQCTVHYDETITVGFPFSFQCKRPRLEVVNLDRDHLHLCVAPGKEEQKAIRPDRGRP